MSTINMPKQREPDSVRSTSQARPKLERYLLQVDRQTKQTFAEFSDAERVAKIIKKEHSIVQVSIYDSKEGVQTMVDG